MKWTWTHCLAPLLIMYGNATHKWVLVLHFLEVPCNQAVFCVNQGCLRWFQVLLSSGIIQWDELGAVWDPSDLSLLLRQLTHQLGIACCTRKGHGIHRQPCFKGVPWAEGISVSPLWNPVVCSGWTHENCVWKAHTARAACCILMLEIVNEME